MVDVSPCFVGHSSLCLAKHTCYYDHVSGHYLNNISPPFLASDSPGIPLAGGVTRLEGRVILDGALNTPPQSLNHGSLKTQIGYGLDAI